MPLVVVEGATDKQCLIRCFQNHQRDINDHVRFVFFQGDPIEGQLNKRLVFDAMETLNALSPDSNYAIGIVDADFMRAKTKSGRLTNLKGLKNLFFTDAHDLDCQIFQSGAFNKFVTKYLVENGDAVDGLRQRCLRPAAEFGYFKLSLQINKLHHLKGHFRDIAEFMSPKFEIDEDLIHNVVDSCTTQGLITQAQADQFFVTVAGLRTREIDPWQLANGHDLFHVLGLLIIIGEIRIQNRKLLKYRQEDLLLNADARKYFAHRLEHHVRKFYDLACFKASGLYRTICTHQDRTHVFFVETTTDIHESIEYITRGLMFHVPAPIVEEEGMLLYEEEVEAKRPNPRHLVEVILPSMQKAMKPNKPTQRVNDQKIINNLAPTVKAGTFPSAKKASKKKKKKNKQTTTQQKSAKNAPQGVLTRFFEEEGLFTPNQKRKSAHIQDIEAGTPPLEKKQKVTKKKKKKKQAMTQQQTAKNALHGVILSEDDEIKHFLRNLTSVSILSNDKDKTHFCTTARNMCLARFHVARTQSASLSPEAERSVTLLLFSLVALLAWLSQKTPLTKKDYKTWVQTHLLKGYPPSLSGDEKRHLSSIIYDAVHLNFGKENIPAKNIKMVESNANFLIRPQDGSYEVNLWVLYDQLDNALSKFCVDLRNPNNLLSFHFLRKMLQLKIAYGPLSPR